LGPQWPAVESACAGQPHQIVTCWRCRIESPAEPRPLACGRRRRAPPLHSARQKFENAGAWFGLCRWSTNFGRLLVVYYRIAQISRLSLACAGSLVPPGSCGDLLCCACLPPARSCLRSICVRARAYVCRVGEGGRGGGGGRGSRAGC
jgi:hypothetical protein